MIPPSAKSIKFSATLIIIASVLATLLLHSLDFFSRVEFATFDHRVGLFRSDEQIHDDVVVVFIDDESLQSMAGQLGRWPWPRAAYVDLLEYFALAGAQAFAFDILFSERQDIGNDDHNDRLLVEATRGAGNTVHAMQLLHSTQTEERQSLPQDFQLKFALQSSNFVGPVYNDYLLPIEPLYKASRDIGFLEIAPDRDGVYRRVRLFNQFTDGQVFPSLASALVLPLFNDSKSVTYDRRHAEIGSLRVPLDGSGNYLINPYGRVNTYSAVAIIRSMQQIRAGVESPALDPALFEGKLVLLGASAIGLLDVKATALASKEAGVLLHAYTVANLLDQDFLIHPSRALLLAIFTIFCSISVIPVMMFSRPLVAALFPVASAIIYLAITYAAFSSNYVLPISPVLFAMVVSLLLAFSVRGYHEKRASPNNGKIPAPSAGPGASKAIADGKEDRHSDAGTTELLSISFSGINDFTSILESLEANRAVNLLNIYFTDMTEVILDHNGTLDKFIGDKIMAFWGAPIKTEDHPQQALTSAIDMHKRLHRINGLLAKQKYPAIQIGTGIHTGKAILGNIGSKTKLGYTAIGDNVNLASRLESLTGIYGLPVIISEATWKAIHDSIPCILVDRIAVEKQSQPMSLYAPAEVFLAQASLPQSVQEIQEKVLHSFNLYLKQDWQAASNSYSQVGECMLSEVFRARCEQYQGSPPDSEWNGVFASQGK